jgi:hypothetical protein
MGFFMVVRGSMPRLTAMSASVDVRRPVRWFMVFQSVGMGDVGGAGTAPLRGECPLTVITSD